MKGRVIYSTKLSGEIFAPKLERYIGLALKLAAVCSSPTILSGVKLSDEFYEAKALITELGGNVVEKNGNIKVEPITLSDDAFLSLFNGDLVKIKDYCEDENFFHDGDCYFREKISDESLVAVLIGLIYYSKRANVMIDFIPDDKEYIDIAIGLIGSFGGIIEAAEYKTFSCSSANKLIGGGVVDIEADWNLIAFGLMSGALGNKVTVKGATGAFSVQHGAQIIPPLKRMGLNLEKSIEGTLRVTGEDEIFSTAIDALECPEFLPYMILLAALGNGNTEIYNIGDALSDDQSERIVKTVAELAKLGVKFIETGDGSFKVNGANAFEGGIKLDCGDDFIITTTMVLATLCCKKSNTLINYDGIDEQYPDFWELYRSIGGFSEMIL